jgi:DNA-binding MarR family transcriptional regulator
MTNRKPARSTPDVGRALGTLFEETVAVYHRLSAAAASIHGAGALSGPRRTVLVTLARSGPQTVAQMARARAQSRQRFQPLVNGLVADGLVEVRPNPGHKQSAFVALTSRGEKAVQQIVEREGTLRARLTVISTPTSILRAVAVLREVRHAMEAQLPALLSGDPGVAKRRERSATARGLRARGPRL